MKRFLFAVFLLLGCLSIHAESVFYGFAELSLDESVAYRFVKAMDAESQKAIEGILAGKKQTEDKSIIKRSQDEWYVRKGFALPEGNYYESYFYKKDNGQIDIILPRITVLMGEAQLDEVMEYIGNKVTLGSGNNDYGNRYYLDCQVKTSEEVLEICLFLYNCAFDYGILGVKLMGPDFYWLDPERVIYDNSLYKILTETSQPFVPKHEGEVLIYEQDWQGVKYSDGWVDWSGDAETFWAANGTDEGLAITVYTKQGQIWQPQVMVVPDAFPLEAGHDYIVRLTLKVPSDGIYQVNLGSWAANTQYQAPVTASDEWQEIDVKFPQFGWDEEWLYNTDTASRNYLEACHVLLQCGWMVGTTIVKKVQVIEKTKGDTTDANTEAPINDDNENTQDKKLIFEKDWEGVEYTEWGYLEDPPNWAYYGTTDEGLAITNPSVSDQIWEVRVLNGYFSLEEGHDYLVRLTIKVPSDGNLFMMLGSWSSNWYDLVPVTASDDWQVIDIENPNYYCDIADWAYVLLGFGEMVGTTVLKKVQVYEKLKGGETAIKTTKPDKTGDAIYNLSGQKVDASYKGFVIQNGKKRISR